MQRQNTKVSKSPKRMLNQQLHQKSNPTSNDGNQNVLVDTEYLQMGKHGETFQKDMRKR